MTQIRDNQREWISFDDAVEERTWLFDVTFLESSWKCIYGEGCQGIEEHPDISAHRGCCSHGAYFSDDDDRRRVTDAIEQLTSEHWQLMDAERGDPIYRDEDGAWRTRRGEDFGWWCTEATEAFGASEPVYVSLRDELIALCGSTPVYERLLELLDERATTSARSTHPVAVSVRLR